MKHLLILIPILLALSVPVQAQECTPGDADGDIPNGWSAVKKADDTVTISWTAPAFLTDCTPISADPAFAVTGFEFYASLDAPVGRELTPFSLPPEQLSADVAIPDIEGSRPSSELFFAVTACNQFGCSPLSDQAKVKVGGAAKKPGNVRAD